MEALYLIPLVILLLVIVGFWLYKRLAAPKNALDTNKVYHVNTTEYPEDSVQSQILLEINIYRKENGVSPLIPDHTTTLLAYERCAEMVLDGELSHRLAVDEMSEMIVLGADGVGENLGFGYATVQGLMQAWKNSPSHNRNMLRPNWDWIGVGVVQDLDKRTYYCTLFGDEMTLKNKI